MSPRQIMAYLEHAQELDRVKTSHDRARSLHVAALAATAPHGKKAVDAINKHLKAWSQGKEVKGRGD